ncbi:hypothetical protein BDD12DRAFT_856402 [Trichophaea hybrida]|nr:hypothetical protein BDD12DRAFT_856402 [Trichophaea hybrida]
MSTSTTVQKFTYTTSGLLYDLEPRCTQSTILKRFLSPDKLTVRWLRAQLAHYALKPLSGTKSDLEARLKKAVTDGKVRMQPAEMRELEKRLKAEFEGRGGGGGTGKKGKVEKKVKKSLTSAAKIKGRAALKTAMPASAKTKQPSQKPLTVKRSIPKPLPRNLATNPPPKPRTPFITKLLGHYTVTCPTFSGHTSDFSLCLYRQSERIVVGELSLHGFIDAHASLDWVPMAKQSRVPCTWRGNICGTSIEETRGEMEFSAGKAGVRVKGKIEGVRGFGEIGWTGVKSAGREEKTDKGFGKGLGADPIIIGASSKDDMRDGRVVTRMEEEECEEGWWEDEEDPGRRKFDEMDDQDIEDGYSQEDADERQELFKGEDFDSSAVNSPCPSEDDDMDTAGVKSEEEWW